MLLQMFGPEMSSNFFHSGSHDFSLYTICFQPPMDFYDEDLLRKANGEDIITPAEKAALQEQSQKGTWRLRFFNSEKGWRLRRLCRGHATKRNSKSAFCGLCGTRAEGCKRGKTNAYCGDCLIPLCALPPTSGYEYSCHYEWHNTNKLVPRNIPSAASSSGRKRKSAEFISSEEEDDEPEYMETSDDSEEEEWEEGYMPASTDEAVPDINDATARVHAWSDGRTLWGMLKMLHEVLPPNTTWDFNPAQNKSSSIPKLFRRAMMIIHPDKISPTALKLHKDMAAMATAQLNRKHDDWKTRNE